jgi:hypothetical protein
LKTGGGHRRRFRLTSTTRAEIATLQTGALAVAVAAAVALTVVSKEEA